MVFFDLIRIASETFLRLSEFVGYYRRNHVFVFFNTWIPVFGIRLEGCRSSLLCTFIKVCHKPFSAILGGQEG